MLARPFSHLRTIDQWARARHERTAIDLPGGGVMLGWEDPAPAADTQAAPRLGAGLGFDSRCRLYHTLPDLGRVERQPWDGVARGPADDLVVAEPPLQAGQFGVAQGAAGPLDEPRALALDEDDRLWLAESAARRVVLWELWSRRLLRRIPVPGRPIDLARHGRRVLALLDDGAGIAEIEDRAVRRVHALPDLGAGVGRSAVARRLAVAPDGSLTLLLRGRGASAWIVALRIDAGGGLVVEGDPLTARFASDVEWLDADTLVIARAPGQTFARRLRVDGLLLDGPGLAARGYDGLGIARAPAGRGIAYWSADGPRLAVRARVRYHRSGTVTSYALDSETPALRWGRLFVDACVPEGAQLRARFLSAEESAGPGELARTPPTNAADLDLPHPEASPPLPWTALVTAAPPRAWPLYRRDSGREQPWVRAAADDAFATYELPIMAPPGRYLWVTLELSGNGGVTPRVRSVRAEHPAHDHLTRLPRAFSRDPAAAEFLQRYLAVADGLLSDLGGRAESRAALLSPAGAPAEALPWLAGFFGLTLDERWPEAVRRRIIDEAPWLLRFRGTKRGLERLLDIIVGRRVIVLERWRLRGLGGAQLEGRDLPAGAAVVGGGLRVGGAVGTAEAEPVSDDAFATHAHRFAVLVPALLSPEQDAMVRHALEVHRPAHTVFEVCTLGTGMSVGRGLHLGLLSTIGRTGGWEPLVADRGRLGGGIIGRPSPGTTVGAAVTARDTRVG